ncbi:class I SAM-dependent methyltransferase [Phenylobacterium immobile]|uniref:class I SAM-dependent methyltransferase n=1 Tax=Phenylobacterium immobile TaxID=21 RepID=UPI000B092FF2|nr:class I SAM-dependent methyltransferase [Phenylobacterium immobile]
MDGSADFPEGTSVKYAGPRDYRTQGRHAVFPETDHDDCERFNYLAHVNRYIRERIQPRIEDAYNARVEPKFVAEKGRKPKDRTEARKLLLTEPMFQYYSAFRRANMEQRQQAGRWVALRQAEALAAKAAALTDGDPRLQLNPDLKIPKYLVDVHHHCMPGSYYEENFPGDVVNAANYDCGFFVTNGGAEGQEWLDTVGTAIAETLQAKFPDLKPKRILDLGASLGHNAVSLAKMYPDAEIVAVDAGAPMLRYGLARAKSLGVDNVTFVQGDVADLTKEFGDESFDLVTSYILLHEISFPAMKAIFNECYRLVKKGGVVVHSDIVKNSDQVSVCEQAIRDWDTHYNNEPFHALLRELDQHDFFLQSGFSEDGFFRASSASFGHTALDGRSTPEESALGGVMMVGAIK